MRPAFAALASGLEEVTFPFQKHPMKTLTASALLLAVACAAQAQNLDPNATLTQAVIQFTTPRDIENSDVSAEVSLTLGPPTGLVANSKLTVHPGRSGYLKLALPPGKVTRRDLAQAVLLIRFMPHPGRERWIFDYKVRLGFSDGQWAYDDRLQKVFLDRDHPVETDRLGAGLQGARAGTL
jgi:hypothetical protein